MRCVFRLVPQISDRLGVDANESSLRNVVDVTLAGYLAPGLCNEHLLLAVLGMGCSHLTGLDDDLVYPAFDAPKRLGELSDLRLASFERIRGFLPDERWRTNRTCQLNLSRPSKWWFGDGASKASEGRC